VENGETNVIKYYVQNAVKTYSDENEFEHYSCTNMVLLS